MSKHPTIKPPLPSRSRIIEPSVGEQTDGKLLKLDSARLSPANRPGQAAVSFPIFPWRCRRCRRLCPRSIAFLLLPTNRLLLLWWWRYDYVYCYYDYIPDLDLNWAYFFLLTRFHNLNASDRPVCIHFFGIVLTVVKSAISQFWKRRSLASNCF